MNMMRLTKISLPCAVFALALPALCGATTARAADNDGSIEEQVYRTIMEGLGFKRDGEETINYQQRAPLVIPPSRDLPAPEKNDAATANNPSWPNDPDVARRKAQAAFDRDRNISDEREREQNPLRPDQLTPGARNNKKQTRTDDGYQSPASGFGSQLSPSELGYKGGFFGMFKSKEETTKFTGEPPRALLTDPPVGYQTPSPDQPYGVGKTAEKPVNSYTTRSELTR